MLSGSDMIMTQRLLVINAGHWGSPGNAFVLSPGPPTPAEVFDSSLGVTQSISPHLPELKNLTSLLFSPFPLLVAANSLKM